MTLPFFYSYVLLYLTTCLIPDLYCGELPPMTQGSFQVSGDYFGARVTYSCEDAFFMSGARERVCQGDGTWSDSPPTCKKEGEYIIPCVINLYIRVIGQHCAVLPTQFLMPDTMLLQSKRTSLWMPS